jgi:hypothetical protein
MRQAFRVEALLTKNLTISATAQTKNLTISATAQTKILTISATGQHFKNKAWAPYATWMILVGK